MNETQIARLNRLKRYSTRYELIATHPDGRKVLVGYTRKGRDGMLSMMRKNGEAWVKFSGCEDIHFARRVGDGATSGEWTINFSGRTQREAIMEGELPFFPELVRAEAA